MKKIKYCEVWLRGIKGIFSWHTEEKIAPGARVIVKFRGRKRIGIVVAVGEKKPEFETQNIEEILDKNFIDEKHIEIAKIIATENFCLLEKVLSLMVPEAFSQKKNPEKREVFYSLKNVAEDSDPRVRGDKQKLALEILSKKKKVSEEELRKEISLETLRSLLSKGIIEQKIGSIIDPFRDKRTARPHFDFTPDQKKTFEKIKKNKLPTLLFGVTGSGKTEIYKKLALAVLEKDNSSQVLFLLPEIALTPQLIAEFYGLFGDTVTVWHSKLSEGEKIQEFARIRTGEARILVGARSAVLVPLRNPKLIILDEEHEWTYKNEFAPRLWAHQVAEITAEKFGAKLLFGSATPRLESFKKCEEKEWTRVDLPKRVFDTKLPEIELVDFKNEMKKGNDSPISEKLEEALQKMLKTKKQAVFFLNKRGFSGATLCRMCGHTFECPDCESNMKLHRKIDQQKFLCHICGKIEPFPVRCPECEAENFEFRGWGTQQVETILKEKFPGIRVFRADADSVSGKNDFENLMNRFHNFEADILLGTQMVAKGLDFERVSLVGIILADIGLSLPDFRSEERVFDLLMQVSGRAGRRGTQGKIILQTFHPEEQIFQFLQKNDVEGFIADQIDARKKTNMPPFGSIAKILFSDLNKGKAFRETKEFYEMLKKQIEKHPQPLQTPLPSPLRSSFGGQAGHLPLSGENKIEKIDFVSYNKKLVEKARENRKNTTPAEGKIWKILKNKQFVNFKFIRQKPLYHFIADFYCAELMLIIEIDGGIHTNQDQKEYDKERTEILKSIGIKVIRYTNDEVFKNFSVVCEDLSKQLKQRKKELTKTTSDPSSPLTRGDTCLKTGIEGFCAERHKEKDLKEGFKNLEVHFAPAFFPKMYGKYHFHVFLRAKTKQELIKFLQKIELPTHAKIDIDPVSLL